jgi:hypothetical protein
MPPIKRRNVNTLDLRFKNISFTEKIHPEELSGF